MTAAVHDVRDRVRRRGRARIQRRLAALASKPVNFDASQIDMADPPPGWTVDRRCQPLPSEAPGEPEAEGSWRIARRLIRGYEFADPSLVRAHYDPNRPLEGRDMLLELRALGLAKIYAGTRIVHVYDEERVRDGRRARVFGWAYRTLEGHVEQGQMDWQVWKWLDTGEVQFRVHAVSRTASIHNPFIAVGFWLLKGHERALFLNSTDRRMRTFTELALREEQRGDRVRDIALRLTARRIPGNDQSSDQLARNVEDPTEIAVGSPQRMPPAADPGAPGGRREDR
jgi:uncharacterized protein (UPF0548 family)